MKLYVLTIWEEYGPIHILPFSAPEKAASHLAKRIRAGTTGWTKADAFEAAGATDDDELIQAYLDTQQLERRFSIRECELDPS